MSKRITIIVGCGFDRDNNPISATDQGVAIVVVQQQGVDWFGGLTITRGEGVWRNNGKVIAEPCLVIVAVVVTERISGRDDTSYNQRARDYAQLVRTTFNQSSVVLAIDDCSLSFID